MSFLVKYQNLNFTITILTAILANMRERKYSEQNNEGIIRITAGAYGFIDILNSETVFIPPGFLGTALDGDIVKYQLTNKSNGKVLKVIKRAKTKFVGKVDRANDQKLIVKPNDPRFYTEIEIEDNEKNKSKIGYKVLIEISRWEKKDNRPQGTIIETIGKAGTHETEMKSIIFDKGFSSLFPEEVEREAQKIKKESEKNFEEEITKRRDFRNITTFTIDPLNAKDFDDALSIKDLGNGRWEIGVHIADVSHYVKPDSIIDIEAKKRATSIYLVDRTIPMLPEVLSNDLCSLVEGLDRLVFSAVFILNEKAEVEDQWFGKAIINSDKRFTYEEANKIIKNQEGLFCRELTQLNKLAELLDQQKIRDGALAFTEDEFVFEIDEKGKPINILRREHLATHKLVEDFMLLANKKVAEFVSKIVRHKDLSFVYRVHDAPEPEKLDELLNFIKLFGHKIKIKGRRISSQELNDFLKSLDGSPDEDIINRATIRSMNRAFYSMKNIGHFGLAFSYYTHFTSPIRRYPDVMVHRLLEMYSKKQQPSRDLLLNYNDLCTHSSEMEKKATEAERESIKYKQAEYLETHLGEIFDGVVSGVTKWGLYTQELSTGAEGLIRIKEMTDDSYEFDEKKFLLRGQKNKKTYRLGDPLKIKVLKTDKEAKTIDFGLVG